MKKLVCILLTALLLSSQVFAATTLPPLNGNLAVYFANNIQNYINKLYKYGISSEDLYRQALEKVLSENPELLESAIIGMTENLDDYSTYLTPEEYADWIDSLSGAFVGIGVTIEQRNEYIVVVAPIKDSGAERAGILSGDKIVSVDGENVVGQPIEAIRSKIVGDIGTTVNIGILRDGKNLDFTITRSKINQTTVSHHVTEEGIGYIGISSFAETTPDDVKAALKDFDSKKIKKLIIDVRNNPGGELNSLLDTLRLFMPKGDILYINYKDEANNIAYKNDKNNSGKYKIVVLANENSASAAEAFAASMKDSKSAKLVGNSTFGKGSMQLIQKVVTGGAIKLTVALYRTAGGSFVDKKGVEPDYMVKNAVKKLKDNPEVLPLNFSLKINEESSPEDIEAAEIRLKLLSIHPGTVDGVFDEDLEGAISKFQSEHGLGSTGILDISTQVELDNATRDIETTIDSQYLKAVQLLND